MKRLCLLLVVGMMSSVAADVVVLRNGSVISGRTDLLGSQIVVDTGTAQVRIERRNIEDIAPTLVAAYERKRTRIPHPTADQHLALAEWCMRNELWPQAALELNDARLRDARHPDLELLESRLRVAYAATQRAAAPPAEASPTAVDNDAEMRELEQVAAATDPVVVEQFSRQIQLLLANNCTTSGCHMAGSGRPLELNRDIIHNTASRRSTLRNLRSALAQIDASNPADSPLVTVPAAPHGNVNAPVFTGRRAKLHDKLVDWAYLAAGTPRMPATTATPAAASASVPAPLRDANVELTAGVSEMGSVETEAHELENVEPVADDPAAHFWENERKPRRKAVNASLEKASARDEFDPEIFNRRYHGVPVTDEP